MKEKTTLRSLDRIFIKLHQNIYSLNTSATTLPTAVLFKATDVINTYGFAVEDNKIYIADALNNQDPGEAYIYSLTGTKINSFTVGILPNGFYFND